MVRSNGTPRFGKKVSMIVGEPVDISDILLEYRSIESPSREVLEEAYQKIANRVGEALYKLSTEMDLAEGQKDTATFLPKENTE